jgi:hypothetical protein
MRELEESLCVALLNCRGHRGQLIVVPDPMRHAKAVAANIAEHNGLGSPIGRPGLRPAAKPRVTWQKPGA